MARMASAARLKALGRDGLDDRYAAEDIARLLEAGGGARWHEERAERVRRQIAEQGTITEPQRRELAFHEESAAAIRPATATRGELYPRAPA